MKSTKFFFVLGFEFLMLNCAGTPKVNPMVQEAQQSYKQIKTDSLVVNNAPVALKKAAEAVKNAKNAAVHSDAQISVKQQALLAKQRVKIARTKAELRAAREEVRRASRELRMLLQQVRQIERELIKSGQIEMKPEKRAKFLTNFKVRQTNRGLVLRFLNLSFDLGKPFLTSRAEPAINELANFLHLYPERTVLIEGHTDNTGSKNLNKKLSRQRANFVREALIARGIAGTRIRAIGLGEQYPLVSNSTSSGRRQNRRVVVIISDKSSKVEARD